MDDASYFGELKAKIEAQSVDIDAAKAKVADQEDKMEEMEDMITALAYTLKELDAAVQLREPRPRTGTASSTTGSHADADDLSDILGQGMPTAETAPDGDTPLLYGLCFGYLWKQSTGRGIGTQWKKRWFVLKNDGTATYFKNMADSTSTTSQRTELSLAGYIPIAATDTGKPFGFRLVCTGQRPFTFAPDTENEETRTKWLNAFKDVIKLQTGSGRKFRKTPSIVSRAGSISNKSATYPTGAELLESATLSGYLELQKSENVWVREFFAIVGYDIVQLSGEDAASIVKKVPVAGSVIDILWEDPPDEKERAFSIIVDGISTVLNAESDEAMGEWVSMLTNLAQSN